MGLEDRGCGVEDRRCGVEDRRCGVERATTICHSPSGRPEPMLQKEKACSCKLSSYPYTRTVAYSAPPPIHSNRNLKVVNIEKQVV